MPINEVPRKTSRGHDLNQQTVVAVDRAALHKVLHLYGVGDMEIYFNAIFIQKVQYSTICNYYLNYRWVGSVFFGSRHWESTTSAPLNPRLLCTEYAPYAYKILVGVRSNAKRGSQNRAVPCSIACRDHRSVFLSLYGHSVHTATVYSTRWQDNMIYHYPMVSPTTSPASQCTKDSVQP